MGNKAIVLLSGGQDSTTCLGWALAEGYECVALSFDYGQRHARELQAAAKVAEVFGVENVVLSVPALAQIGGSALVDRGRELRADGGLQDAQAPGGLPTSFVPGRNALFLTLAASLAVSRGARVVVTGVCQTDYSGYPDCRQEFVDAMARALTLAMPSGCGPIELLAPLMHLTKAQTVELAYRDPRTWQALADSVTCYEGVRGGCGACPACTLRAQGFAQAGVQDPACASA